MTLLPTSLVGSYPQPEWLIDRARLGARLPARVRARELWRVGREHLAEAHNDATVLALADQHHAGVDIVTDGETRRGSYSNNFAAALSGLDPLRSREMLDRTGKKVPVPRVIGRIVRVRAVEAPYVAFLKAHANRPIKVTLPGPFTMTQQSENKYYSDEADLAMAYAEAVNAEVLDLFAAGVDVVQLDEPYVQARPERARDYAVPAIDRALRGATGTTVLHVCFGYGKHVAHKPNGYAFLDELDACVADEISLECAQPRVNMALLGRLPSKRIHVGVIDLRDLSIETPAVVADRIRAALAHLPARRCVVAPDCGMKYLPRDIAFGELKSMVQGRDLVRSELEGSPRNGSHT